MNVKLYHYHPVTFEYTHATKARPDPLVAERYLKPKFCTTVPVIEIGANEAACFNEDTNSWYTVIDFRGTVVEAPDGTGRTHTITELNVTEDDIEFEPEPEEDYKVKRRIAYPQVGDQLDALMKMVINNNEIAWSDEIKALADECMAVKQMYPKDE